MRGSRRLILILRLHEISGLNLYLTKRHSLKQQRTQQTQQLPTTIKWHGVVVVVLLLPSLFLFPLSLNDKFSSCCGVGWFQPRVH